MRKFLHQALFVLPFVVLIAAAIFMQQKMKTDENKTNSATESVTKEARVTAYNRSDSKHAISEIQNYKMTEPFAAELPGEGIAAMQNAMNPYLWMQLMTHSMNQMMAIPVQMMPMMSTSGWINPHSFIPNLASAPTQPMDPKEYEKLYNEREKALEMQE